MWPVPRTCASCFGLADLLDDSPFESLWHRKHCLWTALESASTLLVNLPVFAQATIQPLRG
eukprot:7652921-Alexandrium_andersonii.AAC.1